MTRGHVYTSQRNGVERIFQVSRLWELSSGLEPKWIDFESLKLNKKVWFKGSCPTITEIAREFEKVLIADLSFPIILDQSGSVMDGYHRIVKAMLQSDTHIQAVQFEINPEPDEIRWFTSNEDVHNMLQETLVELVPPLHREHDRIRLWLFEQKGLTTALTWSEQTLKLLSSTTAQLRLIPKCLTLPEPELREHANIALLDLLQLDILWQNSALFGDDQNTDTNEPRARLWRMFQSVTERLRAQLLSFANDTMEQQSGLAT